MKFCFFFNFCFIQLDISRKCNVRLCNVLVCLNKYLNCLEQIIILDWEIINYKCLSHIRCLYIYFDIVERPIYMKSLLSEHTFILGEKLGLIHVMKTPASH